MTPKVNVAESLLTGLVDLHRHLDGSMRPETLRDFAHTDGVVVPKNLAFTAGMGLSEALSRFRFTLDRLHQPQRVAQVAHEMCEDARREGVTTLEIRFGPQLHAGHSPAAYVDAAIEGIQGRAGLILCALYGDSPQVIDELVSLATNRSAVVGIDLAGGPLPSHSWTLKDYDKVFRRAREVGLGLTIHAGEGRPAEEIRVAIEHLGAQRIGHGTTLLQSPGLVDLIRERNVCIEACVTSTGMWAPSQIDKHTLVQWIDLGISVCICTDNTLLSSVNAPEEYAHVQQSLQLNSQQMRRVIQHGHQAAFRRSSRPANAQGFGTGEAPSPQ